jgi:hypothetical protein
MKKKLLYLTLIMLFSALSINAQTTWDFGTDTTNWPIDPTGYMANVVKQNLGIFPPPTPVPPATTTSIGQVDLNTFTFTADGYAATKRFKMGGTSAVSSNKPTSRFLYFAAAGSGSVKIWFRSGSNSATRTISVSDGTTVLGSLADVSGAGSILDVPYNNVNGNIYIYNYAACYIYKIVVTGSIGITPALATKNFQKELDVAIYAKSNKIFLSNVKSSTKVNVYNVLGALVKTAQVDADSSLDINSGIYIVNAKSAEGEKSVKVIVQ